MESKEREREAGIAKCMRLEVMEKRIDTWLKEKEVYERDERGV